MDEGLRYLLNRGIAAAKSGEKAEARRYLERMLYQNPDSDAQIEAWYWLNRVSDDPREKRRYLEEILACAPFEPRARRELAILDGKLNPSQVIDPDRLAGTVAPAPATDPKRMVCPNCGGRLTYSPDGASLVCESCESRQRARGGASKTTAKRSDPPEQDFIVAMATTQGHLHPETARTIACKSCGAEFLMLPQTLSLTCPYCNSIYVVENAGTHDLVAPSGLIPFQFDQAQARRALEEHLAAGGETAQVPPGLPLGLYLPAWCFTIAGQAPWNCQHYVNRRWESVSGSEIMLYRNLLVAASPTLQQIFPEDIRGYDLSALVPYDPAYLADWPAETYQISMSDASLNAQHAALGDVHWRVQAGFLEETRELTVSPSASTIESFKLILLPVWTAKIGSKQVMVNGQTGIVWGDQPGLTGWLKKVFR